jgi:hypothetical protein
MRFAGGQDLVVLLSRGLPVGPEFDLISAQPEVPALGELPEKRLRLTWLFHGEPSNPRKHEWRTERFARPSLVAPSEGFSLQFPLQFSQRVVVSPVGASRTR